MRVSISTQDSHMLRPFASCKHIRAEIVPKWTSGDFEKGPAMLGAQSLRSAGNTLDREHELERYPDYQPQAAAI
jgi:hypothetical protein